MEIYENIKWIENIAIEAKQKAYDKLNADMKSKEMLNG